MDNTEIEGIQSISDAQARYSLAQLICYVFEHRDGLLSGITYEDLADRIDRKNRHGAAYARGMGRVLGRMGHMLQNFEGEWGERIPHLQSLVVLKTGPDKGLPDSGLKEFWPEYEELSRAEKEHRLGAEYQRILDYGSRWNDVLAHLGVPTVRVDQALPGSRYGAPGGESPQHRALKEYVRRHPALVGAEAGWPSFPEYALPSLDVIDVVFKSATRCVAVEVKSGDPDMPGTIRTVLALQSKLPERYHQLASDLHVEVLELVGVEASGK